MSFVAYVHLATPSGGLAFINFAMLRIFFHPERMHSPSGHLYPVSDSNPQSTWIHPIGIWLPSCPILWRNVAT